MTYDSFESPYDSRPRVIFLESKSTILAWSLHLCAILQKVWMSLWLFRVHKSKSHSPRVLEYNSSESLKWLMSYLTIHVLVTYHDIVIVPGVTKICRHYSQPICWLCRLCFGVTKICRHYSNMFPVSTSKSRESCRFIMKIYKNIKSDSRFEAQFLPVSP